MVSARYHKPVILCVNASQNAQTFMTLFAAQTERTTRVNAFLSHRLAKPRLRSRWSVALKSVVSSKVILRKLFKRWITLSSGQIFIQ